MIRLRCLTFDQSDFVSRMARAFLIGLLCIGASAWSRLNADNPITTLLWHNEDRLVGELLAIDENSIELRSRLFQHPVRFDRRGLQSIHFESHQAGVKTIGDTQIVLQDGSILRGKIVSNEPNGTTVNLKDDAIGLLVIKRSNIKSIEQMTSVLYEWNGDIDRWKSEGAELLMDWGINGQGFLTTTSSQTAANLPLSITGSFAVNLVLSGHSPNFVVSFGEDQTRSLRLETAKNRLLAATADDFEVVSALDEGDWRLRCRLEWDDSAKLLRFIDEEGEETTIKGIANERPTGIFIKNKGDTFTIEQLEVFGSLTQSKDGFALGIKGPSTNSNASNFAKARFVNGSLLVGRAVGFQNGLMIWRMTDDQTITINPQYLSHVEFSGQSAWAATSNRLVLGPNRLSGEIRFDNPKTPVQWKSQWQADYASLNMTMPCEISFSSSKPLGLTDYPDLVYLKSGEMLPANLSRIDGMQAQLATPFSPLRDISTEPFAAIEFHRRGKPLEHKFTAESREQLLGFPRGTDASLFRHALIGNNGDLLRGIVVSLNLKSIEMEVRLEPSLIPREAVSAIVFLSEPKELKKPALNSESIEPAPKSNQNSEPDIPTFRIELSGGFGLDVKLKSHEDGKLRCISDWLGEVAIPISSIDKLTLRASSAETMRYAKWATKTLSSPTWLESDALQASPSELLGKQVEDFSLASLRGESFRLSEHAGQVVVLDFWATWCGPCVKLLPEYLEVIKSYSDIEVVLVGVNATETPEVVRDYLEKKKIVGFDTLFDYDASLSRQMQVQGIPHTVLIGTTGKIEYIHSGYTKTAASSLKKAIDRSLGRE